MIELRTLGDCQIVIGDERLGPQSPHAFALALFLGVERGRPHARDDLLAMFFPGVPEANAAHSLRQTLYKLRQLGVPAETTPAGTMIAAADVRDDYSALVATGELPDPGAVRLPGQFLPGYWPRLSDEFARWLEAQRDTVGSALRRAYVSRILDRRAVARWDEVERYARACLVVDPLNEEATLALAESLALSGSKAAGVKVLDRYLEEVGREDDRLTLPATVLRKRISERLRPARSTADVQLLGRDDEIRDLNDLLLTARGGQRTAVWIYGEAGIGKTRLISEFSNAAMLSGARLLNVACHAHDTHRTLGVWSDIVPSLLNMPGALGCSSDSFSLLQRLCPDSLPYQSASAQTLPTTATHGLTSGIVGAINELLEAISTEALVLLSIDDLHWADPASLQVLYGILSSSASPRAMLAIGSRTPPHRTTRNGRGLRVIHLKGINRACSEALLQQAASLAFKSLPSGTLERAAALGAGNPFFLRSLAEHFLTNTASPDLPSGLTEILEHRIRTASAASELVVLACALLGQYALLHEIETVLSIPRFQLAAELDALERSNLIVLVGDRVELVHSLIADSVRRSVAASARQLIHRACAESLERLAKRTGCLATYWAAHDCWIDFGDAASAARCAGEAATIDALGVLIQAMDDASRTLHARRRPADDIGDRPLRATDATAPTVTMRRISATDDTTSSNSDPDWLLSIALDEDQSIAARIRAAVAAITLAEFSCDRHLAAEAYTAALRAGHGATGSAKSDLVRANLAYHTVFGDQAIALRIAATYESRLMSCIDDTTDFRSAINAAESLPRCGEWRRGLSLLDACYTVGLECNSYVAATCPIRAAWIARQVNSLADLTLWQGRAEKASSDPRYASYPTYLYNKTLFSLDQGDVLAAQSTYLPLKATLTSHTNQYHRTLIQALTIRLAVAAGSEAAHPEEIDELRRWSLRTARLCPEDDVAYTVTTALLNTGSNEAAISYFDTYMDCRRTSTYPVQVQLNNLRSILHCID